MKLDGRAFSNLREPEEGNWRVAVVYRSGNVMSRDFETVEQAHRVYMSQPADTRYEALLNWKDGFWQLVSSMAR